MRVVITGGAGFLGAHLCERLLARGDTVTCVDNLSTGTRQNLAGLAANPRFEFVLADVADPARTGQLRHLVRGDVRIDAVVHLASPASPPDYHRMPLQTLAAGSHGTEATLELAHHHRARFVLASTSEVYGDPLMHPQHEEYWGNVNPIGPRSVYDEAKRYAEALTEAYRRSKDVRTGIVRIFNTYGPRMRPHDGRVVSSFIVQALSGDPLTIYGDGGQTRSFCYVDDLTRALVAMIDSNDAGPINIGSAAECSIAELAAMIRELTGSRSPVLFFPLPVDDPARRRPDISRARSRLNWQPQVEMHEGLSATIAWFASRTVERVDAAVKLAGPPRREA